MELDFYSMMDKTRTMLKQALDALIEMDTVHASEILTRDEEIDVLNKHMFRQLIDKIKALDNVEIIYNASTKEILGNEMVSGIIYEDTKSGEKKQLEVQGVMVHIGMIPNSQFVTCGKKNKIGEIEVTTKCETDCPGVFAAGDVTNVPFKQIAIAAGQGVTAALSAIEYINKWEEKK